VALATALTVENLAYMLATKLFVWIVMDSDGVLAINLVLQSLTPNVRAVTLMAVACPRLGQFGAEATVSRRRKDGTRAGADSATATITLTPTTAFRPFRPFAHYAIDGAWLGIARSGVRQEETTASVLCGDYNLPVTTLFTAAASFGARIPISPRTYYAIHRAEVLVAVTLFIEDGANKTTVLRMSDDFS
jgi:hypothetical protein